VPSLLASLFLSLLFTSYCYIKFVTVRGGEHPFSPTKFNSFEFGVPREQLEQQVELVTQVSESVILTLKEVFFFKNFWYSLKVMILVILVKTLGDWFSLTFLMYLAFLLAFSWPRFYEDRKPHVDAFLGRLPFLYKHKRE